MTTGKMTLSIRPPDEEFEVAGGMETCSTAPFELTEAIPVGGIFDDPAAWTQENKLSAPEEIKFANLLALPGGTEYLLQSRFEEFVGGHRDDYTP